MRHGDVALLCFYLSWGFGVLMYELSTQLDAAASRRRPGFTLLRWQPSDSMQRRRRRVIVLLIGIVLLSLADLAATVTHLKTVGMVELNPIAHYIIDTTRSAWGLAAYKLLTVSICVALLYRLRHHIQGEIAAWAGLLILSTLTIYWGEYSTHATSPDVVATYQAGTPHDKWLTLVE